MSRRRHPFCLRAGQGAAGTQYPPYCEPFAAPTRVEPKRSIKLLNSIDWVMSSRLQTCIRGLPRLITHAPRRAHPPAELLGIMPLK